MSLFPDEDILTKEIESWRGFADSLHSEQDRKVFEKMLNDCYRYAAAINLKGEPFPSESLLMALLLSQHKIIHLLAESISKRKLSDRQIKEFKQEQPLDRENKSDYIRKNERIHYIDDY